MKRQPSPPFRAAFAPALLLIAATLPAPCVAQLDPTGDPGPLFDGRDAWIAGAYVAAAALSFPFDEPVAVAVRDSAFQDTRGLKPTAAAFNFLGVPGSLIISGGLYGVGRIGGIEEMADAGLHIGEAIVVAELVTYTIKLLAGRARPALGIHEPFDFGFGRGIRREDHYRSFPSGHTSAAFATAAAAAHEIERIWGGDDWLIGLATYGPAALVGLSRMFDNKHWTSDVVFGAAIGAFSGWKVVRYNHANPDNPVDSFFLAGSVVPGDWRTLRLGLVPR
ncbi:MAG: phosphatase PAP2 family protein [Gemmatimonadota bacterium]